MHHMLCASPENELPYSQYSCIHHLRQDQWTAPEWGMEDLSRVHVPNPTQLHFDSNIYSALRRNGLILRLRCFMSCILFFHCCRILLHLRGSNQIIFNSSTSMQPKMINYTVETPFPHFPIFCDFSFPFPLRLITLYPMG